ncbi:uncharacterized protein LOC113351485 [Papaver somniferum]|uniref:uncharacterized protein LOC113351485 n=1 Tax=Papaver somniferum TaxID=3469 RepID=UPI000E703CF9|nr:uncharacterized protein LOC113351485 [Papaver somniferum]
MAMFPGEGDDEIHDQVPGEVASPDFNKPWTMFFDGSLYDTVGGEGVVFEEPQGELMSYSFNLDFPCSNNVSEYEALILELRMAKEIGFGGVEIRGDSRLVTNQVNGDFHVKDPHLSPYRAEAQNLISQTGSTLDHTGRGKNKHAESLATLDRKIQLNDKEEGTVTVRRKEFPSTWKEDIAFEEADYWRQTYIDDLTRMEDDRVIPTQTLKQFVLIQGALYYRATRGSLARCVNKREAEKKYSRRYKRQHVGNPQQFTSTESFRGEEYTVLVCQRKKRPSRTVALISKPHHNPPRSAQSTG